MTQDQARPGRPDLAPTIAEYLTEDPAGADPNVRLAHVVNRWPDVTVDEFERALRIADEIADATLIELLSTDC